MEDWQQQNLEIFRTLVHQQIPEVTEAIKWGVPVFSLDGTLICAMSVFKNHTKFNFFKGAFLEDPDGLFNSGLDSKEHRSINLAANEAIDQHTLLALIDRAAAFARNT